MSRNIKNRAFPIVLKTIIDDAMRDATIANDDAKKIRAKIRACPIVAKFHVRNTSHVANNQSQYDAIRSSFDARYRERLTTSRKRKTRAKSNDVETSNENA